MNKPNGILYPKHPLLQGGLTEDFLRYADNWQPSVRSAPEQLLGEVCQGEVSMASFRRGGSCANLNGQLPHPFWKTHQLDTFSVESLDNECRLIYPLPQFFLLVPPRPLFGRILPLFV